MDVSIWVVIAVYSLPEFVYAENNTYKEGNCSLLLRPWESIQGYLTVRPGAHMFYWLYYADGTKTRAETKPLIIMLTGGPDGLPASGLANFEQIGPFNTKLKPRNHTWLKGRNVLLFDEPIGIGFSYVTNNSLLVKDDQEKVIDLYQAIKSFLEIHKEFRNTPTYIFGQYYGGKTCPELAYYLHKKIKQKCLQMNLKGIGIGSGYVDPKESALRTPEALYNMGLIDHKKYLSTTAVAKALSDYMDKKEYDKAELLQNIIVINLALEEDKGINLHNIHQVPFHERLGIIDKIMNTYVKPALSDVVDQKLQWICQSFNASRIFRGNAMVPTTGFVELLLNETEIKVVVYNGNLDAVNPITAASNWVHNLKWQGAEDFRIASRIPLQDDNGFYKANKKLSLWWIYRAGLWVPEDNPAAMEEILEYIVSDN